MAPYIYQTSNFAANNWLSARPDPISLLRGPSSHVQTRSSGEGRGLGLFTTRSIPAYSEILREAPLILLEPTDDLPQLYEQFISLRKPGSDEALQRRYLALSHQEVPQRDQRLREKLTERGFDAATVEEMVLVAGIMQTNAFNVDVGDGMGCNHRALFPQIARINHSCVPNAHVCYYPSSTSTITATGKNASSLHHHHHHRRRHEGRMVVHALRNLHEGEEVQIAYFSILLSRPERQTKAQKWGFTCRCPACEPLPTRHDDDDDGKIMRHHEQVRTAVVDFTTKKTALLMQQQQQNHRTSSSSSSSAVKQITNLITLGHNTISQVLDDHDDHDDTHTGGFHPTLPDLYSNLSDLQARALLLRSRERKGRPHQQHDEEVEKEDVISSLQLAAIWEAKLTGMTSPATKKRLLQLEKCAARQDATTRSPRIVAGTGIGAYAIEWMPPS
ncbi:hypothetical protein SMMN14_00648 [Sphaerulina musiva]